MELTLSASSIKADVSLQICPTSDGGYTINKESISIESPNWGRNNYESLWDSKWAIDPTTADVFFWGVNIIAGENGKESKKVLFVDGPGEKPKPDRIGLGRN